MFNNNLQGMEASMITKEEFIYIPKVDSARLSIAKHKVKLLKDYLWADLRSQVFDPATGEVFEELTKDIKGHKYLFDNKEVDGTYVEIGVTREVTSGTFGVADERLYLLINSKHLHKNYFKGITRDTFRSLYDYIMSLEIFYCKYEDFQDAHYRDLDICFDFSCGKEDFKIFKKNLKLSVKNPDNWHSKNQVLNTGIYAPTKAYPRKSAKPGTPYVKFYDKELDFNHRSTKFSRTYFKGFDYTDLYRYECSIISGAHKERLGLKGVNSIWDLLECDLHAICIQMFKEYFWKEKIIKVGNLRPLEKVIIDFMNYAIENGMGTAELLSFFDRTDVSRSRKKDLLEKYHRYMNSKEVNKKTAQANQITLDVFSFLGVKKEQIVIEEKKEKDKK
jgi:hypothetical protein